LKLESLLTQERATIVEKWFNLIVETYPADTAKFLKKQKNQFANPVGHAVSRGVEGIFSELLSGFDAEKVSPFLDNIIRVRAIQDFKPSAALSFLPRFKDAVRELAAGDMCDGGLAQELLEFESRLDQLTLLAFDIYSTCRDKISDIRVNEVRHSVHSLLKRAKLICEVEGEQPEEKRDGHTENAT